MTLCLPFVPDGDTIPIPFYTSDSSGGLIAPSTAFEAADVKIYKDGSATERTSQSGWTMTSPFDGKTGSHMLTVDLSDNTDPGFYSVGSWFTAQLEPDETVDSQTVGAVLAIWRIVPAEASAGVPDVNVASMDASTVTASAVATAAIDADAIATDAITATKIQANAITAAKIAASAITAGKIATAAITAAKFGAGAINAAAIATDAITAGKIAADAIGASELATDAVNEIRDSIIADATTFNGADIALILADTDDIQTRLPAALVGGRMDSDVGNMQAGTVDAAAIATNAIDADALATDAVNEINSTVDTALQDIGLDHLFSAAVVGADITDDSFAARLTSSAATADYDTFDNTTDSLQALQESGLTLGAGDITQAALDEIADTVLRRDGANVEAASVGDSDGNGNPPKNSLYGLTGQFVRKHERSADGRTGTVYLNNGLTVHYTVSLTSDRGAAQITGQE